MGRQKLPISAEWGEYNPAQIVLRIGKKQIGSLELCDDYGNSLLPEKLVEPLARLIEKEINLAGGRLREALDG